MTTTLFFVFSPTIISKTKKFAKILHKMYFQPFDLAPIPENESKVIEIKVEDGKLTPITRQFFIDHIFDFRKWKKMAEQYKGKVMFYKVNADKEKDLCNHFGVQALPTLFFIPADGKPIIEVGATPEKYVQIIEEQLLK